MEKQIKNPARVCGHLFREGDWLRGWRWYSFREMDFWGDGGRTIQGVERWSGQPLLGKRLLLTYEQALGEQVLFSSMVPDLADMVGNTGKITIEVDARLVNVFKRSFPYARIVEFSTPWHKHVYDNDYHCLMGNPGLRLRPKAEQFPKINLGYIKSPLLPWGEEKIDRRTIGLSWYSSPTYAGKSKSVPLSCLEPILADSGLVKIDLQYGCPPDIKDDRILSTDHMNKIQDIEGLTFLVGQCTKVVTISNFVAHLAGAMGKETFVLLKQGPARHWYWDLPFYPNVTRVELYDGQEEKIIADLHKKLVDNL